MIPNPETIGQRSTIRSVLLQLVLLLVPAIVLWSLCPLPALADDTVHVTLSTFTGDTSQGSVGFSEETIRESISKDFVGDIENPVEYYVVAVPAEGYSFKVWLSKEGEHYAKASTTSGFTSRARRDTEYIALFDTTDSSFFYVIVCVYGPGRTLLYDYYQVESDSQFILPEYSGEIKKGADFGGWQYGSAASDTYSSPRQGQPGEAITVSEDIIVNMLWDEWDASCKISFSGNGAQGDMDGDMVRPGTAYTLPSCMFSRTDKVFAGWNLGQPGDVIIVDTDIELVAQWKEPDHVHYLVKIAAVPATCESPGTEAYWKCSACGKLFADAEGKEEISAPKEIAALGHDWGEWKVTKEPTATTEGEKVRTCKHDPSHTETVAIPATGGEPEPYAVVDSGGTAPIWDPESEEGLTFTVKRMEKDDATYAHFTGVAVDGVSVPPLGYTAQEGSLILTLLPDFLESLGAGSHDVAILFDDGTVTASFSIAGPGGEAPTPDPGRSGLPVWAWILIGLAGAAAVAFGVFVLLGRSKTAGRANPGGAVHRRR